MQEATESYLLYMQFAHISEFTLRSLQSLLV